MDNLTDALGLPVTWLDRQREDVLSRAFCRFYYKSQFGMQLYSYVPIGDVFARKQIPNTFTNWVKDCKEP